MLGDNTGGWAVMLRPIKIPVCYSLDWKGNSLTIRIQNSKLCMILTAPDLPNLSIALSRVVPVIHTHVVYIPKDEYREIFFCK